MPTILRIALLIALGALVLLLALNGIPLLFVLLAWTGVVGG